MLYQNIKALCLINDIKMSYLEELIGRSRGYISSHREKIRFNELLIRVSPHTRDFSHELGDTI